MRLFKVFSLLLSLLIMAALAAPTFAAQGGAITNVSVDTSACTLTVVAVIEDAGDYYINIVDDGVLKASGGGATAAGSTITAVFNLGVVENGIPGIGVSLKDVAALGPIIYDTVDPYVFDAGECVSQGEAWSLISINSTFDSAACPFPLPAGSIVYSIPQGAPTFYAADLATQNNFNLNAGTWYISEFSGDFAKVWIACQARPVWVPSNAVAQ